ncbi:MAG: HAMP domain-containing sensor histidine kinase [Desulfobacca sp.]|nr:HAMP domain-containing sensor histidine kinase [Desulfobacca sp.]
MARWNISLHLNIRQKVIVGLTTGILAIGFIGVISYHYLQVIELKQRFVEKADDFSNVALETRRYEKNYLLYGSADDLAENRRYIEKGLEILDKIAPELRGLSGEPQLHIIRQGLLDYKQLMDQIADHEMARGNPDYRHLEEKLRNQGKKVVDISKQLVTFERLKILQIIRQLKGQLLVSIGVFLGLGVFLVIVVSRKIIRPLATIEKTTLRIAQGNYKPLPVLDTRDETQRVVEAFNRMVEELEKRQDQLVQSKKMSSLGVLTSGVAHQLNNPLNNISTSCQILLEELDQCNIEFFKRMLTNVEQEVNRARDIVKGLLDFSRVRDFALKPTLLHEVVERSIKLVSSQVPTGIQIAEDVPKELVLNLDAQQMQEVFLNLILNAVQAIAHPPGEIKIAAYRCEEDSQQAIITVEDTGMGIPKETLERIFDPFFTTKEVGLGTGLVLSIVYGIIEKHYGTVAVESKVGEGTRFIIRLPCFSELEEGREPSDASRANPDRR